MIAEGGTEQGHMETIARSDSPWGPWESCPHNPILSHRSYHSPLQALGHADLCQAHDGTWWLVCLGIRTQGYPPTAHLGRETLLAPVRWDDRGWPNVGHAGKLRVQMEGPTFANGGADPTPVRDDFDAPTLGAEWVFLGTPTSAFWSLAERAGALRLQGSPATLDDGPPVAFVARRQTHFTCEAAAQLDFDPQADGEEAGLTVWMNPHHHYDLFVTRRAGLRHVAVRRRIGSLVAEVMHVPVPPGPVTVIIGAEPDRYTFAVTGAGGDTQTLAAAEPRYLAPEVAGGFTGVCFALYTTGSGRAGQHARVLSLVRLQDIIMANDAPPRHLEWEGCFNARDLGGLPTLDGGETCWQSVIRADYPGTLSPAGLEAMLDYGVRTLIDIRSPQEAAAECYQWAETSDCRRLHLPIEKYYPHVGTLIRQATSLVETYCIMVDAYPDCVAAILGAVAVAPPGGVLVHCLSGKDRTGVIAALLLSVAGVPNDAIAADYALSQARLWPEYEQRLQQGLVKEPETLWTRPLAEPAAMHIFLDYLAVHYGGAHAYLVQAGLSAEQILQIRQRLVPGR